MSNKTLWKTTIYSALNVGTSYMEKEAVPKMNILVYDILQLLFHETSIASSNIPYSGFLMTSINKFSNDYPRIVISYVWSIGLQGIFNLLVNGKYTALVDSILVLVANFLGEKVRN